jgi:predicted ATPase
MKIYSLEIKNFKAIQNLKIENLSSLVLIAGGNGVGKSTIFDAIRLVKSSYGEYNQNEIQNWYNEFDIRSGNNSIAFEKVLREKDKTLLIDINLILFQSEKEYLLRNGEKLIQSLLWRSHTNQFVDPENETFISIASQNRAYQSQIEVEASQYYEVLKEELKHQYTNARIEYKSGDVPKTNNSITTEILFGFYTPSNLGIIDYHGAHRNYQRENISTLNVNFTQSDQYRHHTL